MWRWLKRGLLGVGSIIALAVIAVLVAGRDLDVAVLEERYYGAEAPEQVDIDGVGLRYQVTGQGPPLLLIHSHFFSMRMWDGWVAELADRHTLIRFDMTSHGLTGPDPSGDYSMDRSLALIDGLLDHLGIESSALVGSSLGGNMAFSYAATRPERVTGLVLVNSGGMKRENSRAGEEVPGWADAAIYLVPRAGYRAFLEWMIHDDAQVTDALAAEFHDMFRRRGNRPAELDRIGSYTVDDPAPVLAEVRVPTLVLWGRENPQLPYALAEQFRAQLVAAPRVDVQVLPDVGHVMPIEAPVESAAIASAFLADRP